MTGARIDAGVFDRAAALGRWDAFAERARATRELRPVAAGNRGR